jgi:hypothetical protein
VLDPVEAFDSVAGRDTWYAGSAIVDGRRLGPPLNIRSVAANANGGVLFANVHVGGIPRSTDGGMTWQPTIDIDSDVHEVCAHQADPDIVIAASAVEPLHQPRRGSDLDDRTGGPARIVLLRGSVLGR